ncbi:SEC12-like protein 2 [Chenopodium quinoa]|uniref:SEC12-like protein 2 n=1 Tax=Chenopodium quinoa TaxID=63459 RepID=UPI000B786B70|nr:SEC12-like protein 2 [Chenopodium quinoa]
MELPNTQRYGVPLYGASWVPSHAIRSTDSADPKSDDADYPSEFLVLAGGGGEGRSGIPNAVLLSEFDFAADSLSPEPVFRVGTANELPYRMAVHPRDDGLICSFPNSCRWFDWDMTNDNENGRLGLVSSDKVSTKLEDVGQQLALTFSEDGSLLAAGGEDGKIRVFKWPSLEVLFTEEKAYTSVKDLHFSIDGKYLASVGSGGPCKVWDVTSSKAVASLAKENDEIFRFCRFSQSSERDQVLYTLAMRGKGGSIISWNTKSWKRITSKHIVRDAVTAFNVSVDGKLLAIGTNEGDLLIINSSKMQVQMNVKKAHLGLVTALTFSRDSRALGSASMDSSVRVTLVQDKSANGLNYWIIIFIILLAIAMYYLMSQGLIPGIRTQV